MRETRGSHLLVRNTECTHKGYTRKFVSFYHDVITKTMIFFDRQYIALHTNFQCSGILFRRGYWRNSVYEILKSFWTSKISPSFIIIKSLNQCCTFLTSSVVHELKHSSDKDFNKDTRVSILKLSPNLDCVCFMHKGNFHPTNIEK